MTTPPKDRQDLYDRIRSSSQDEVILEEMQRLGFWARDTQAPQQLAEELRRERELERQLRALGTENRRLEDVEAVKKALHKQRLAESRQKRQETKRRREEERVARAQAWQQRKETDIVHLGPGVSYGLQQHTPDLQQLAKCQLPVFHQPAELAAAMGITLGELRFLAYTRRSSKTTHYRRFHVPKKSGGERLISAPMPRLKRAQLWILQNILDQVALNGAAHGFRAGRSIVSNARPHVGADVVVNVDLEDFFPTITLPRIKGVFRKFGYPESVATVLALICSEPDVDQVELDGKSYYVAQSQRYLPQGAPTSPALTNVICRGLDARLSHVAEQLGFVYTRYADDITFSANSQVASPDVGRALRRIRHIVRDEGFQIHPRKTRILRRGVRQEVTGLTVNRQLGVSRKLLRRFRATLYHIERDGPLGKHWGNSNDVMASIEGFAHFVAMVDPEKGKPLQQRVQAIIRRYGRHEKPRAQRPRWSPKKPPVIASPPAADDSTEAAPGARPKPTSKKPWWKFW